MYFLLKKSIALIGNRDVISLDVAGLSVYHTKGETAEGSGFSFLVVFCAFPLTIKRAYYVKV